MINLQTFQDYLSFHAPLKSMALNYIGNGGERVGEWTISLSMVDEIEQCHQVEKVLSELMVVDMPDEKRLAIMEQVLAVVERVVSSLHGHYVYETSLLSKEQCNLVDQVKSLYYLSILVYDGIVNRLSESQAYSGLSGWKALLPFNNSQKTLMAVAIFHLINLYLKLLMEHAMTYQRVPALFWQQLNRLYLLAMQQDLIKVDVSKYTSSGFSETIYASFCQVCLYSLLNLSSYRRQDILGIHKVLPLWSRYLYMSHVPDANAKVFINLQGQRQPEHITPYASVNPYESGRICLFINLAKLTYYLEFVKEADPTLENSIERRMAKIALISLPYQYQQWTEESSLSVKRQGLLVAGFYRIHYHLAGKRSLSDLIHSSTLADSYQPKIDTNAKRGSAKELVDVQILDKSASGYRLRLQKTSRSDDGSPILALSMQVLSVFALQPNTSSKEPTWELGIVRWIENDEDLLEAGGYLVGTSATACGVRLENNDRRSQDFVPALLIAANKELQTKTTLMIPRYHFRTGDRVIMRIGEKQIMLRLEENLLSTDDIEQYHIVRLATQ